jgi:hypothetical protein
LSFVARASEKFRRRACLSRTLSKMRLERHRRIASHRRFRALSGFQQFARRHVVDRCVDVLVADQPLAQVVQDRKARCAGAVAAGGVGVSRGTRAFQIISERFIASPKT